MFVSLARHAQNLWRLATEPPPSIRDVVERRQSRLLASLLAVTIVFGFASFAAWIAATPLDLLLHGSDLPINAAGLIALGALYGLARTRFYQWSAVFTAILLSAAIFGLSVPDQGLADIYLLDLLFLPIFIASLLLPPVAARWIALANIVGLLAFPWLTGDPAATSIAVYVGPLVLNVSAFGLIFVGARHRNQIERDRQTALRQSEQRFATAFRFNPAAMAIVRLSDGRLLDANDNCARALGYSRTELMGRAALELASFADPAAQDQIANELAKEGAVRDMEVRIRAKSGENRTTLISVERIELASEPCALVAFYDITDRKRAEADALRRAEEFAALYEVSRDIATQQDLPTLLQTIVNRAAGLMRTQNGHVFLYDPIRGDLELVVNHGDGSLAAGTRVPLGRGICGRVAQTRQPLIVNDYSSWTTYLSEFGGASYQAVIQVPMMHGGELIGVLGVASIQAGRLYTESDLGLLTLLAGHAASAVHNARLLKEAQVRAQQLALVYEAGLTLNRELDPQMQLEFLLTSAMTALAGSYAEFFRCDPITQALQFEFGLGYDDRTLAQLQYFAIQNSGAGKAAQTLTVLNLPNVAADPTWVAIDSHIQSGLWAPIIHQSHLLGVMGVLSQRPAAFDADAERLIMLFANQVAVAMENARLFAETRLRLSELESLNRVSVSLRTAQTLNEMLPRLLDETLTVFETDSGVIWLYDDQRTAIVPLAIRGWFKHLGDSSASPGQGIVGHVFATGEIHVSSDFNADPLLTETVHAQLASGWGGACVPIRTAETVVGVMCVAVPFPRQMSSAEVHLLTTLAEIAGSATHRMTLVDLLRRRAAELATVNALGRALAETLELNEVYERVYQATSHLLPDSSAVYIYLFDAEQALVTCAYGVYEGKRIDAALLPPLALEPPGVGMQSEAIHSRQPVIANDFGKQLVRANLARELRTDDEKSTQSALFAPMLAKGEVIGIVQVQNPTPNRYNQADAELLSLVGNTAAAAVQNARLFAETQRRLERLQALRRIDNAISSSLDQRVTLAVVLDQVITQLGADAAVVLLLDSYTQTLQPAVSRGFRTRAVERATIRLGEGAVGQAALERRLVQVPDLSQVDGQWARAEILSGEGFQSYFVGPLIAKGQVKGVLEVFHRSVLNPDKDWLYFLEMLAGQAAIAIESAALFEDLQRSNIQLALAYDTTLEGWSHALDLRDKETEGHTQRVTDTTMRLARAMNIEDSQLLHLRRGALLHDIGKMGIPDSILLKSGPLTDAEWEIMRRHPVYAYELLSPIAFLRPALDIPYCHHERWDGTGYPRGLKGEQIPLAARIFAVADVWDALISDRPYRPAWIEEKAINYICDNSGAHFDPQVVYAFVQLLAAEGRPNLPVGLLADRT